MGQVLHILLVALLGGFAICTAANISTTVLLHRALSHRALTLSFPVAFVLRAVLWLTTGIKPKEWVAVHRKHHAFTDEDGDPHSPVLLGWKAVQKRNVMLYREALADRSIITKYAKDIEDDRWDKLFFNRQKTGLILGIAIAMVLMGPIAGFLAAFVHTNLYLAGNAGVNAMGHHFGKKPYPNNATNLQWLAFFTMGEGLHNNHHAAPSSARLSHRRGEIDPGWWVIKPLTMVRLAKLRFNDIKLAPGNKAQRLGNAARSGAVNA
jgi:stearoyl-CoA desaturase (delta-9 desaturase)